MNWDTVKGQWKMLSGKIKEKWGKITDNDLAVIEGKRDRLVGKIQERYGYAREKAENELAEFEKACGSCESSREAVSSGVM